jgi:chorismate lyase
LTTSSGWLSFERVEPLAPDALRSWLAEPGLLTARIRTLCGEQMRFRRLGPLRRAELSPDAASRLAVPDTHCLLREIEFRCGDERIVYAQTVLPDSTVTAHPWLRDLGDSPIGETLRQAGASVERQPLEYAELAPTNPLAVAAACGEPADALPPRLWARRAVYRLGAEPILVQEVFLPALLRHARGGPGQPTGEKR